MSYYNRRGRPPLYLLDGGRKRARRHRRTHPLVAWAFVLACLGASLAVEAAAVLLLLYAINH